MLIAAMGGNLVSFLILVGFAIGTHVEQDSTDPGPRSAIPQPSLVDLGAVPFGGIPRQRDHEARTFPLETLITLVTTSADTTEHSKFKSSLLRCLEF